MKTITTFLFCIIFLSNLCGQTHKNNLNITYLSGDFYVFTTYREFKGTPFPSNGMYVVTHDGVVLIDTPWDTTQFQPLLDSIKIRHNQNVVICVATHSHEDRTGGLEYYKQKGIKTYTSLQTDQISKSRNEKQAAFLMLEDTVFTVGQYSFQTYYAGAGHTPDNIVIWFPKNKILYGGCLVKSTEAIDLGNLNDADPKQWPSTIKKIKRKFGKPNYVIPGHQNWTDNTSLDHTLKLLRQYKKENLR
ncbi:MAG: BlaB/IND/MUS family subclass B1 metallo-beta-lactamase [Saprospiraceae bacterium]|nr:BlaB/IND/MUS family subclass B1 metallo-beta-lactamase [Candidatus Defluviibacterium haderslevense]